VEVEVKNTITVESSAKLSMLVAAEGGDLAADRNGSTPALGKRQQKTGRARRPKAEARRSPSLAIVWRTAPRRRASTAAMRALAEPVPAGAMVFAAPASAPMALTRRSVGFGALSGAGGGAEMRVTRG